MKLVPAGAQELARALVGNHCESDRWPSSVRSCVVNLKSLYEGLGSMPCFENLVSHASFRDDLMILNTRLTELASERGLFGSPQEFGERFERKHHQRILPAMPA